MKKYELTDDTRMVMGKKLTRIKALISFSDVEAGELGGYIEKEENLSHEGDAWVADNAWVTGDARVRGNARVNSDAWVYGNARVDGDARVTGNARVDGDARVAGNADILHITGLGTMHQTTTAYRTAQGIEIVCGYFRGDLDQFRKQVEETSAGKVRKEYLKFAELIEIYFEMEE